MHQPAPRITQSEASWRYPGWRVVLVCFAMALFCWGFGFYGHAVYLAELQRLHGWPAALISGATTVYYFGSAILVVFVSDVIARLGARGMVLAGIACLTASLLLLAFITTPWQLYAAYLVMAFGWAAMSLGAISNIVGLWFWRRRGLAISLALAGASFSGVAIVPAMVAGISLAGFRITILASAAVMLLILVPLVIAWLEPAVQSPRPGVPSEAADAPPPARWTRASALRSVAFWSAAAPFALALTAQVGFIVHQIAFLEPTIGRNQAALAVAITTAMAVLGRVVIGSFIDRLDPRLASGTSMLTQSAALVVMLKTSDPVVLMVACAIFGLSVGNLITFPALVIQREFEAASFGLLIGLSTAVGQFTYAFGPGLLGLVRDATGGYGAALALCIALNTAAAAIVMLPRIIRMQSGGSKKVLGDGS